MKETSKQRKSKPSGQANGPDRTHRTLHIKETLVVEKLGPIGRLEIQPRPLTILIGEQASGKSLVALLLYFFRGLESHLGRIYNPDLIQNKNWPQSAVRKILDGLRAVPFNNFANGTDSSRYIDDTRETDWKLRIYEKRRSPYLSKTLKEEMCQCHENWSANPEALGQTRVVRQVFIPTERAMYTRLAGLEPSVLYAQDQPEPLRRFGTHLKMAAFVMSSRFRELVTEKLGSELRKRTPDPSVLQTLDFIEDSEIRALGGMALFEQTPSSEWVWGIPGRQGPKIIPIEATASGQMEAWPFFAVALTTGVLSAGLDFYFEEPETHLHPRAQVEVMKVIAYLVNMGHRFVVTTHSPFIGYVVDNMMQRYMSHKGKVPKGQIALNPDDVAAYRLRQRLEDAPEDIMDRKDTKLLKLDELEQVADELGKEFDELMDMAE
ncbi:MAG: AAA family ATPase [Desulfomonilaceae bacterium]